MTTFVDILAASNRDKVGLFEKTATIFSAVGKNIEKDLWVALVLDLLFNRRSDGMEINFKGGTSLSKGFGLIHRFSEDVDITVARAGLDTLSDDDIHEARAASNRRHLAACERIATDCGAYVSGPLAAFLAEELERLSQEAGFHGSAVRVEVDASEQSRQNLLIHYPSVFQIDADDYVRNVVKLEAGARGSTTPIIVGAIEPYINKALRIAPITISGVPMIDPVRTFFEKVTAVHAFRQASGHKSVANRLSRHYYDLHEIWGNQPMRERILTSLHMLDDVREHKLLMFFRRNENMHLASAGTLTMTPDAEMRMALADDYRKMSGMIFNEPPPFDAVMESIGDIDTALNAAPAEVFCPA